MRHARVGFLAVCMAVFLFGTGCRVQSGIPIFGPEPDARVMDVTGQYQLVLGSIPSEDVVAKNHEGNVILYKSKSLISEETTGKILMAHPLSKDAMIVQAEEDGFYFYYVLEKTDFGFVRMDVDIDRYRSVAGQPGFPKVGEGADGDDAVKVGNLSSEELRSFFLLLRDMPGMLVEDGKYVRQ